MQGSDADHVNDLRAGRARHAKKTAHAGSTELDSTLLVAERNASWAQLRERRLQQQAAQRHHLERQQCPFAPVTSGATYLAASGGGSSLDVVARSTVWQHTRDARLQAARAAQSAAEVAANHQAILNRPLAVVDVALLAAEPGFMAPTVSASHRIQPAPLIDRPPPVPTDKDGCHFQLPEWAAPRSLVGMHM